MHFPECVHAYMREARDPLLRRPNQRNRAFDPVQRPHCEREALDQFHNIANADVSHSIAWWNDYTSSESQAKRSNERSWPKGHQIPLEFTED